MLCAEESGPGAYDLHAAPAVSSRYGTVDVDNTPVPLAPGASGTRSGTVTALAAPPSGRILEATTRVTGPNGILIGTGIIDVQSVTGP